MLCILFSGVLVSGLLNQLFVCQFESLIYVFGVFFLDVLFLSVFLTYFIYFSLSLVFFSLCSVSFSLSLSLSLSPSLPLSRSVCRRCHFEVLLVLLESLSAHRVIELGSFGVEQSMTPVAWALLKQPSGSKKHLCCDIPNALPLRNPRKST